VIEFDDRCEACGEELDGFSPCSCTISSIGTETKAKRRKPYSGWGMREMVKRKLARKSAKG